ncbi:hypothetical protein D3C86_2073140 [compost metagenome]
MNFSRSGFLSLNEAFLITGGGRYSCFGRGGSIGGIVACSSTGVSSCTIKTSGSGVVIGSAKTIGSGIGADSGMLTGSGIAGF